VDFAGRGAALAGAHIAGMMISGLLSGILADLWGRRSTLLLGLVANGIFGTLSVFVFNARQLCILRFLLGLGLGMVIAGVVPLVAEISPPSNRGRYMTLVSSTFTAGFLFSSIAALTIFRSDGGSGQWRIFLLINTAPTIVAGLLVYFMVPESPRFYLSGGRVEEAVAASNMVAARIRGNISAGHDDPLTVEELKSHLAQVRSKRFDDDETGSREKEALVVRGTMSGDGASKESLLWGLWKGLRSISQVFVHGMYKVTVPIQVVYFCLMAVTGVETWWTKIFQSLNLQTDAYFLSFCHTLAKIPGMMIAAFLIDRVGRRRLIITGFVGASLALLLLAFTASAIEATGDDRSVVVFGLACLFSIFLCMTWLSLDCLATESFPTKVRSTGRGVCVGTGRFAGVGTQFLYGTLVGRKALPLMLSIGSISAVMGLLVAIRTTDTTNAGLNDHWDYAATNKDDKASSEKSNRSK